MRKHLDKAEKKWLFKGSVFAVFPSVEEAGKFLKLENLKYNDTDLLIKWQWVVLIFYSVLIAYPCVDFNFLLFLCYYIFSFFLKKRYFKLYISFLYLKNCFMRVDWYSILFLDNRYLLLAIKIKILKISDWFSELIVLPYYKNDLVMFSAFNILIFVKLITIDLKVTF